MSTPNSLLRESRDLLIGFAASIGHRVDSQKAERVLNEAHLNQPDFYEEDWYVTVSSCAEALEFRIRRFATNLAEAVELVHNGLSVATLITAEDGQPTWISIIRESGNRVLVETLRDGVVKWKSLKQLQSMMGLISMDMEATWLVCYPWDGFENLPAERLRSGSWFSAKGTALLLLPTQAKKPSTDFLAKLTIGSGTVGSHST